MDCSLPGSSVHGILQARTVEWVAMSFSRDLTDPGIEHRSLALWTDSLLFELPGNVNQTLSRLCHVYYIKTNEKLICFCHDMVELWYWVKNSQLILLENKKIWLLLLKMKPYGISIDPLQFCSNVVLIAVHVEKGSLLICLIYWNSFEIQTAGLSLLKTGGVWGICVL